MPDTPPNQNAHRYSYQSNSAASQQSTAQSASTYTYSSPSRSAASPSSRHSISTDFGGINIRDDIPATAGEKNARPALSVHPSGLRPTATNQGSVPSSPTRVYAAPNYGTHPGRTNSEDMRHFGQTTTTPRHSSPMHSASPVMSSPYYSTTPHLLNSIAETQQTIQWNQPPPSATTRASPSRPAFAFPPGRDSVSPRSHLHQQSPSHNRHS
jgi:hypothetical protein